MTQLKENPTYRPWSPEDQNLYIQTSHEKYLHFVKNRSGSILYNNIPHYYFSDSELKLFLSRLYKEGCLLEKLQITFKVFANLVKNGHKLSNYHGNDAYWYSDHGIGYRQKMKYQKKKDHEKKSLSDDEVIDQDWREKKGFARDQGRRGHWGSDSRKGYAKNISNRWNRRKEKQAIHHEKYDDFLILKQIHDAWMWD
jgi:hypothetical protein